MCLFICQIPPHGISAYWEIFSGSKRVSVIIFEPGYILLKHWNNHKTLSSSFGEWLPWGVWMPFLTNTWLCFPVKVVSCFTPNLHASSERNAWKGLWAPTLLAVCETNWIKRDIKSFKKFYFSHLSCKDWFVIMADCEDGRQILTAEKMKKANIKDEKTCRHVNVSAQPMWPQDLQHALSRGFCKLSGE